MKKIEDVKAGDEVFSYNEQTEYQTVLQTFERYANDVLSVKVAGESEPLGVTSEHQFFVRVYGARSDTSGENGEWRKAGELRIGNEIRTSAGDWARVESIESRADEQVCNFEVSRNHNDFSKITLKIVLITLITGVLKLACTNSSNPCSFNFNPEMSCRILDELEDDTKLIEYFGIDTNALWSFIYKNVEKTQIQHPKNKVKNFNPNLKKKLYLVFQTKSK